MYNECDNNKSYLNQPVLRPEPGLVCRRSWVQGADVLSGPGALTMQVEAVANFRPHQVAQAWNKLRGVSLGLRMALGLGFRLNKSLLKMRTVNR